MKILANIGIAVVAVLAAAFVCFEGILLTVFSTTHEFWYAAEAIAASIMMLAIGIMLRRRVRRCLTIGSSLLFSLCASVVLLTDFGMREDNGYGALREFSLPSWHYRAFYYGTLAFSAIPAFLLIKKWPRQHPKGDAENSSVSASPRPSGGDNSETFERSP